MLSQQFITVEECAALLDCEPSTVEQAIRERRLPAVRFGRSPVIVVSALNEVLHKQAMASLEGPYKPAVAGPIIGPVYNRPVGPPSLITPNRAS